METKYIKMEKAGSSSDSDLLKEFMALMIASCKAAFEDIVFEKTLAVWKKFEEIRSSIDGGLDLSAKEMSLLEKYQRLLYVADASYAFLEDGVYLLMLLEEQFLR